MTTRDELRNLLIRMPDVQEAAVVGDRELIATVVSSSFLGQTEALRQERVWKYVRENLGTSSLRNIEFIFTNTPDGLSEGPPIANTGAGV